MLIIIDMTIFLMIGLTQKPFLIMSIINMVYIALKSFDANYTHDYKLFASQKNRDLVFSCFSFTLQLHLEELLTGK